jgi:PAS domain S-box-containing protein
MTPPTGPGAPGIFSRLLKNREIWRVVLPYAVFSALWIFFSDIALASLNPNQEWQTRISIYKGWMFVVVTSVLLYSLVNMERRARAKVEAAIRKTASNYREIFNAASEAIFIHSENGKLVDVNETVLRMFGYASKQEVLVCDVTRLSLGRPPYSHVEGEALASKALREGPQVFPWISRRADGSTFWTEVSLRSSLIGGENCVLAVVRDISERKQAEETLRSQKAWLERAERIGKIGGWAMDLLSRRVWASDEAHAIYGINQGTMTFDTIKVIPLPEYRSLLDAALRDLVTGAGTYDVEFRIHRSSDGAFVDVHSVAEYDASSNTIFGVVQDITARKQAEQALRLAYDGLEQKVLERTEELELINKELESFSYSVSHDLRAPLRAVDGFARALKERAGASLDDESARLLGIVMQEGQRMGRLIDDLLAFSRMGRQLIVAREVDFASLARELFAGMAADAGERRIDFEVGEIPPAYGDPSLLRQVLANLLGNAVKYTRGREVARLSLEGVLYEREVEYILKDNGAGFDMAYAGKLFGVFQRLHRDDEFEGTGVGLALVQRIVHRHGGCIWAEAKLEEGATFHFTLPRKPTE